ncbi:helix-turn-helix domain-containing protein [Euzebya pacifica]|uniref:helix-turn-helix transcriptional regulator n=1 Tax=Euzebya pacifica TaxID=1608957 RepID=UPI00319E640D
MDLEQHQSWGLGPLISVDELAAYLGLPKQTIYDWRVSGKGPQGYRIGKHPQSRPADPRTSHARAAVHQGRRSLVLRAPGRWRCQSIPRLRSTPLDRSKWNGARRG